MARSVQSVFSTNDVIAGGAILALVTFFTLTPGAIESFTALSKEHPYAMSFIKFALLATFGECLALRVVTGEYNRSGFGLLPKMIVWGLLGLLIKMAFVIFTHGTPSLLASIGVHIDQSTSSHTAFSLKVLSAFSISACMNLIFAPVLMTVHKITDLHIQAHNGKLQALARPINFPQILREMDWDTMYHFIFKKTIPFFWIPAHTITFLLPSEFQILFAALLGIALGLILAFAGIRKRQNQGVRQTI